MSPREARYTALLARIEREASDLRPAAIIAARARLAGIGVSLATRRLAVRYRRLCARWDRVEARYVRDVVAPALPPRGQA